MTSKVASKDSGFEIRWEKNYNFLERFKERRNSIEKSNYETVDLLENWI